MEQTDLIDMNSDHKAVTVRIGIPIDRRTQQTKRKPRGCNRVNWSKHEIDAYQPSLPGTGLQRSQAGDDCSSNTWRTQPQDRRRHDEQYRHAEGAAPRQQSRDQRTRRNSSIQHRTVTGRRKRTPAKKHQGIEQLPWTQERHSSVYS